MRRCSNVPSVNAPPRDRVDRTGARVTLSATTLGSYDDNLTADQAGSQCRCHVSVRVHRLRRQHAEIRTRQRVQAVRCFRTRLCELFSERRGDSEVRSGCARALCRRHAAPHRSPAGDSKRAVLQHRRLRGAQASRLDFTALPDENPLNSSSSRRSWAARQPGRLHVAMVAS